MPPVPFTSLNISLSIVEGLANPNSAIKAEAQSHLLLAIEDFLKKRELFDTLRNTAYNLMLDTWKDIYPQQQVVNTGDIWDLAIRIAGEQIRCLNKME